ncbi:MAG: hypothetical protein LBS59_04495 [Puniceicoccales bacterium]|jgi:hypothetical protein|nr:hypothetical protein [Puniceicoccales bacterium]
MLKKSAKIFVYERIAAWTLRRKKKKTRHFGFSLALTLLVTGFLMLLGMTLIAFLTIDIQVTQTHASRVRARLCAVAAARMALGELQLRVGRDQAVTFPSPNAGNDGWVEAAYTGVPGSNAVSDEPSAIEDPVPLVSGNHFLIAKKESVFGWTEISPAFSSAEGKFPAVRVPWIGDGDAFRSEKKGVVSGSGRFAFWVQDESQKSDAGVIETRASTAQKDIQIRRQLVSPRHALDEVLEIKRGDLQVWREGVSQAGSWGWMELAWRSGSNAEERFPLNPRQHTWGSRGVLADTVRGGLRINWDQKEPVALGDDKLPCSREAWVDFFNREKESLKAFFAKPTIGLPVAPGREAGTPSAGSAVEGALRRFPILSGLRVRFGVFHTHRDAYNRVRFHAEAQLWNPWAYPLTCVEKDFIGVLDFEKMPVLTVTNLNTGGVNRVDMGAFPLGKFTVQQTPSDTTINANLIFHDTARHGMSASGLLAGEVYHFFIPSTESQPEGLARTLSGAKWLIQSDPKKANTPPAGATDGNWLHASHQVEIRGEMPPGGVTLHIREAKGKFATSVASKDYSEPVLTLKNIPFSSFVLQLSGAEFDRAESSGYRVENARFGLSLRLRSNEPERILEALEKVDPREMTLDFSKPEVLALYDVTVDVVAGKDAPLATNSAESFWWDAHQNKHSGSGTTASETGFFSDIRTFDRPSLAAPLSVASLRHLPRTNRPSGVLNPMYPKNREEDSVWFDRAFFAGGWTEKPTTDTDLPPRPWTRNPWLELIKNPTVGSASSTTVTSTESLANQENAAAHCFTRGVFNVNTCEAAPWRVVLARALPEWKRQTAEGVVSTPSSKSLKNTLFRLPFGADQPRLLNGGESDFSDTELRDTTWAERERCEGVQGMRMLDSAFRDRLAAAISLAVKNYQIKWGRGFRSLHEFAASGVLNSSIEEARVNTSSALGKVPAPMSPLRLNSGDVLESLLPAFAVRGDTFKVRVCGAALSTLGAEQSRADAEILVQRLPEFCDTSQSPMTPVLELNETNRFWGRRLKIIYFRWLSSDEK